MIILKVIGIILLSLLGLLILPFLIALPIKIKLIVGYNKNDGFILKFVYSFLKIDIFPKQESEKDEKTTFSEKLFAKSEKKEEEEEIKYTVVKKKKSDSETEPTPEKKENFFIRKIKSLVFDDYLALLGILRKFLKRFRFDTLDLFIVVATKNAADTAFQYGALSAALFPLLGFLHNNNYAKEIDAKIDTDFSPNITDYYIDFYTEVYIRTIFLFSLIIKSLIYILKVKEQKNGK